MLTLLVEIKITRNFKIHHLLGSKKVNNQSKLSDSSTEKPKRRAIIPIIQLERTEAKKLAKGDYVIIKCRVRLNENDSPTFDLPIPYFGTGNAEEFLSWKDNLQILRLLTRCPGI